MHNKRTKLLLEETFLHVVHQPKGTRSKLDRPDTAVSLGVSAFSLAFTLAFAHHHHHSSFPFPFSFIRQRAVDQKAHGEEDGDLHDCFAQCIDDD